MVARCLSLYVNRNIVPTCYSYCIIIDGVLNNLLSENIEESIDLCIFCWYISVLFRCNSTFHLRHNLSLLVWVPLPNQDGHR